MNEKTYGKSNKKNNVLLWISGSFIIGLVILIFIMSSQNGARSQGLSRSIIRFIKENIPMSEAIQNSPFFLQANFNILLRKLVHFTEFFILASILYFFLVKTGFKKWYIPKTVLVVSLFFAILDEIHQVFVRGRSGLLSDVIVDFAGAALAVLIIHTVMRLKVKSKFSLIQQRRLH